MGRVGYDSDAQLRASLELSDRDALLAKALHTVQAQTDPPLDRVYPGSVTAAAAATAEDMLVLLLLERGPPGMGLEELLQANKRRFGTLALDSVTIDRTLGALVASHRVHEDGKLFRLPA